MLEYKGGQTQKEIVQESMLSARTVRYALERLQEIDAVTEDVYFADARQSIYEIRCDCSPEREADAHA